MRKPSFREVQPGAPGHTAERWQQDGSSGLTDGLATLRVWFLEEVGVLLCCPVISGRCVASVLLPWGLEGEPGRAVWMEASEEDTENEGIEPDRRLRS